MALDGDGAFFTRTDGVFRVAVEGGRETTIANGTGVDAVAVGPDRVWFIQRGEGRLLSVSKTGGTPHSIASVPSLVSVYDLAADGSEVFGVTTSTGVVWRAGDDGFVPIATGFHCPANVAVRGGDVHFANNSIACDDNHDYRDRAIVRARDGASRVIASAEQSGVDGVAVDDQNVYWAGDGIWCARR